MAKYSVNGRAFDGYNDALVFARQFSVTRGIRVAIMEKIDNWTPAHVIAWIKEEDVHMFKSEIVSVKLTDGSKVYAVRVTYENKSVDFHCIDHDWAKALESCIQDAVSYVE